MRWSTTPAMIFAGIGFVGAAVVFGSSLADAVFVEDTRLEPSSPAPLAVDPQAFPGELPVQDLEAWMAMTSGAGVHPEDLDRAVGQDLFLPDRSSPLQRYRLPGETVVQAAYVETETPEAPQFRIVGTAVIPSGGLALIQLGSELPIAVSVGESILGYELAQVNADVAFLVGDAGRLMLPVVEAQVRSDEGDRRGRDNRGRENEDQAAAQALLQRQLQMQQMLQEVQMRGGRGGFTVTGRGRGGGGGGGGGADPLDPPEPSNPL